MAPKPSLTWIDVGGGSGALSDFVIQKYKPEYLFVIDQSEGFIQTVQSRLGRKAVCKVGNAVNLPVDENSVHVAVSGVVLNFIPEPGKALEEMKRVTQNGGMVASYIWDYGLNMEFLHHFWVSATELKQDASNSNEAKRFFTWTHALLKKLFMDAGSENIKTTLIVLDTNFTDFDFFWNPFLGGQGPAPSYLMSLDDTEREKLKELQYQKLPIHPDGSISLSAKALAIKDNVKI